MKRGIFRVCIFSMIAMIISVVAAAQSKTNILFCIADDASWLHISAYKKTDWVQTPNFDRVAQQGLLFARAYTPNAKCAPSRAAVLTGRNPWSLEEAGNHNPFFPSKYKTVAEALAENGYFTGFTGKGWGPGVPGKDKTGEERLLTGKGYNSAKLSSVPTKQIIPNDYAANFEKFLQDKPKDQPFFFWVGFTEPHRAYEYGSGIAKTNKKLSDIDYVPPYWVDNERTRNDMLDYAYEVEYFDQQLGRVLDVLEKSGELENTLVLVTSDNGMPFPRVKGHMYEMDNHMPLAAMWKSQIKNPGRTVNDFVSFIDFAPTFLQAAGVGFNKTKMQPIHGMSLFDILKSEGGSDINKKRDHVLVGRERQDVGRPNDEGYPVRGIVTEKFFYTRNYEPSRWPAGNPSTGYMDTDGSPAKTEIIRSKHKNKNSISWKLSFGKKPSDELYELPDDEYNLKNLAYQKEYSKTVSDLKKRMEAILRSQGDPRMFRKGYVFDKYIYAPTAVRNFYERFKKGEKMVTGWINSSDFDPENEK